MRWWRPTRRALTLASEVFIGDFVITSAQSLLGFRLGAATRVLHNGILPVVSFVKPGGLNDGHPTSSKWNLFEAFTKKILEELKANPALWHSTAVSITVDEGSGYWDSGHIQPLDLFGDGPRIPLIVVLPIRAAGAWCTSMATMSPS
jgi:hypothetical protein